MSDWWVLFLKSWNQLPENEMALYLALLAIASGAIGFILNKIYSKNSAGNTQIQTINIGLTLEEHEQRLKRREMEVRAELKQTHAEDRQVLERELSDIEQQLQDTQASYETYIASLIERIAQLEKLRGEFPDVLLDQAIEVLRQGNNEEADRLFQQIEVDGEKHIKRVAEAAFQRAKIAENDFRYKDALQFYEKNVRLQPENRDGWNQLGHLYRSTGELTKAENAYNTVLELAGNDPEWKAAAYGNLGILYQSRGDLDETVQFYNKSLTIYQELDNQKGVANQYGNLGLVYQKRGEFIKAVKFYEAALDINQELGRIENTANNCSNLGDLYEEFNNLDMAVGFWKESLALYTNLSSG